MNARRRISAAIFLALAVFQPASARGPAEIADAHAALAAGDYKRALSLAEPAAEAGDAAAQHLLGYLYEKGLGVSPDIGRALSLYGEAAAQGSADAQIALGELALDGGSVATDHERAMGWFRLAAAQGDARAEVRIGEMYLAGAGVSRNAAVAARYFAKASARGSAEGAFQLGLAHLQGEGVEQNYAQGARYLAKAAAAGHGEAAYHLALLYDSPALGAPDPAKAVAALKAATDAAFPPAFGAMGLFAHRGDAPGAAADWFEQGAALGDPQSTFLYALALIKGDGGPRDPAKGSLLLDRLIAAPATPSAIRANAEALSADLRKGAAFVILRD